MSATGFFTEIETWKILVPVTFPRICKNTNIFLVQHIFTDELIFRKINIFSLKILFWEIVKIKENRTGEFVSVKGRDSAKLKKNFFTDKVYKLNYLYIPQQINSKNIIIA